MEAEEGIEPSNDGFANHCLTTWLLRHSHGTGASDYGDPRTLSTLGFRFGFRLEAELAEPEKPPWQCCLLGEKRR